MKTKFSKRRFLAALSAALLISAALVVASCISPLDEMSVKQEQGDNIKPPAGKGLIRISVSDAARTILPSGSLPALNAMYYTVNFRSASTNNDVVFPDVTDVANYPRATLSGLQTATIPLTGGDNYTITITGWSTTGKDLSSPGDNVGVEQAGWTSKPIPVSAGDSSAITAALYGWVGDTSTDTGIFDYDITVPALPTLASHPSWTITTKPLVYSVGSMTIKKGGSQVGSDVDLTNPGNENDTITLATGFYTVEIELTASNCQSRKGTYVMHIYKGKTSEFTYNIPPLNQNKFAVHFDKQLEMGETDTNNISTPDQPNISNAGTVTALSGDPAHSDGYGFQGWFDNASGNGTAWVFGGSGTKVFKDTTLYAKWNKGFTFQISLLPANIPIAKDNNGSDDAGAGPYNYAMFADKNKILSYTITNATNYSNFSWEVEGIEVSNTATFRIDSTKAALLLDLVTGTHQIVIRATHKDGGVPIDTIINITINNNQ